MGFSNPLADVGGAPGASLPVTSTSSRGYAADGDRAYDHTAAGVYSPPPMELYPPSPSPFDTRGGEDATGMYADVEPVMAAEGYVNPRLAMPLSPSYAEPDAGEF